MEWLKKLGEWFSSSTAITVEVNSAQHEALASELKQLSVDLNDFADGVAVIMESIITKQKDLEEKMALNFDALREQINRLPEALVSRDTVVAAKQAEIDELKANWPDQGADQAAIDQLAAELKTKVDPFFPTVAAPVEEPVVEPEVPAEPAPTPEGGFV